MRMIEKGDLEVLAVLGPGDFIGEMALINNHEIAAFGPGSR
jgi:CRP-like cAMP-binding protein